MLFSVYRVYPRRDPLHPLVYQHLKLFRIQILEMLSQQGLSYQNDV